MGKANGAVDLVGNRGGQGGRFTGTDLGHGDVEGQAAAAARWCLQGLAGTLQGHLRGHSRGTDGAGHLRQLLLDRLELADGLAELGTFVGVLHRLVEA
ncbi:hypothetical protein D3C75_1222480 [compost metagenome]